MSCNGCRVLRKGCSETCILRPCLKWLDTPQAQGHATLFLAKFFGRAGLMSFISNVPHLQRPALFQSLLYEACGRTVNPVSGAAGLIWTGNWHVCQAAVETVLHGGTLNPVPEFSSPTTINTDEVSDIVRPLKNMCRKLAVKHEDHNQLSLTPPELFHAPSSQRRRSETPSWNSEGSATTISFASGLGADDHGFQADVDEPELLNLFF